MIKTTLRRIRSISLHAETKPNKLDKRRFTSSTFTDNDVETTTKRHIEPIKKTFFDLNTLNMHCRYPCYLLFKYG